LLPFTPISTLFPYTTLFRSVNFGYYTSTVILMAEEECQLVEQARRMVREIQRLGFSARVETLNTMEAWLGSLPGHSVPNIRRPRSEEHTSELQSRENLVCRL